MSKIQTARTQAPIKGGSMQMGADPRDNHANDGAWPLDTKRTRRHAEEIDTNSAEETVWGREYNEDIHD